MSLGLALLKICTALIEMADRMPEFLEIAFGLVLIEIFVQLYSLLFAIVIASFVGVVQLMRWLFSRFK